MSATPPILSSGASSARFVARHTAELLIARARRGCTLLGVDRLDAFALDVLVGAGIKHLPYRTGRDGGWLGIDVPVTLRRRVAIQSMAGSMRLPYQTLRRRFTALAATGLVDVSRTGVQLKAAYGHSPAERAVIDGDVADVAAMLVAMGDAGYARAEVGRAAIAILPAAVVARVLNETALRRMEHFIGLYGNFMQGVIASAIIAANVRHLLDDPILSARHASHDTPPPDELRRPISMRALARDMALPFETIRRRTIQLMADGLVVSGEDGLMVPAEVLNRPAFRAVNDVAVQHLEWAIDKLDAVARGGEAAVGDPV